MAIDLLIVNSIKRPLLYDNGAGKSNIMKKYQGCRAGVGAKRLRLLDYFRKRSRHPEAVLAPRAELRKITVVNQNGT